MSCHIMTHDANYLKHPANFNTPRKLRNKGGHFLLQKHSTESANPVYYSLSRALMEEATKWSSQKSLFPIHPVDTQFVEIFWHLLQRFRNVMSTSVGNELP
jgi:hypothetical protein